MFCEISVRISVLQCYADSGITLSVAMSLDLSDEEEEDEEKGEKK